MAKTCVRFHPRLSQLLIFIAKAIVFSSSLYIIYGHMNLASIISELADTYMTRTILYLLIYTKVVIAYLALIDGSRELLNN